MIGDKPSMIHGRIDVHSHVLPGLDDGCIDESQSIACASAMVEAGFTHLFCTPHVWPSLPKNTVPAIRAATAKLQERFKTENIPLTLMPGGEINLLEAWPHLRSMKNEEIATYGMSGRHALFDFWADTFAECRHDLEAAIVNLKDRGMQPILAHPERIRAMREPGAIERLTGLGVLFQLNSYCLSDTVSSALRDTATQWLREDRYFFIGSDTHRPDGMASRAQGLAAAIKIAGEKTVERLTMTNPRQLFIDER